MLYKSAEATKLSPLRRRLEKDVYELEYYSPEPSANAVVLSAIVDGLIGDGFAAFMISVIQIP
jgi:hypothetical protein